MHTSHYITVLQDLARTLEPNQRYQGLLSAIQSAIPCDAIALLRLHKSQLLPLAFIGLKPETKGRRFELDKHPRLSNILSSRHMVRFDSDSSLPDPYDGLVEGDDNVLHVHDCMGVSLYINDKPWGVITFDAMNPGQFDQIEQQQQQTTIAITQAVISAAERIQYLEQGIQHRDAVAAELTREQGPSDIIGNSAVMRVLIKELDSVAHTPLSVLIQGETGVGKEIVARYLHQHSQRNTHAFVHLNCAALPETLAESELFGHTKGAFTGANIARSGRFELANSGTLFLDEVGELPLSIQAKLLRALQEGEIQRMGSDNTISVDVRIIAATNRNLQEEVKQGNFRADLFHRLSVFPINVPPLRDRGSDILELAEYFLERNQHHLNIAKLVLTQDSKNSLLQYSWHGNVRELEHLLSRSAIKALQTSGDKHLVQITPKHLGINSGDDITSAMTTKQQPVAAKISLKQASENYKRHYIEQRLIENKGNVSAAARDLAIDRSNLLRLIKRLAIKTL